MHKLKITDRLNLNSTIINVDNIIPLINYKLKFKINDLNNFKLELNKLIDANMCFTVHDNKCIELYHVSWELLKD